MNRLQRMIARLFNIPAITAEEFRSVVTQAGAEQFKLGTLAAKTHWRVIPLPFSAFELAGASYGEFITPRGFASDLDGECTVPAPSAHGYEQRAYYVDRDMLDGVVQTDLICHHHAKFDNPSASERLVPVIVTVLR
ncbi:MAG TPA: hypothetical protein VF680_17550 [Allosphingosinicella sp.]|jgi:hypothetical protein